jgi:hypothetical protein
MDFERDVRSVKQGPQRRAAGQEAKAIITVQFASRYVLQERKYKTL